MQKTKPVFTLHTLLCILLSACGSLTVAPPQIDLFPSPVAFVGAVTPPVVRPTGTATPIILTPTSLLPTPSAKRQAQDTSATIGLWAKDVSSPETLSVTLDIGVGDSATALRKFNPQALSLAYQLVNVGFESNISDIVSSKPNLVLFDKDKKVALSSDTRLPLLNIRDTDVRVMLAEQAATRVKQMAHDGVLLDGVGQDLIRLSAAPIFTGTKEFSEQQRRDAAEGMLRNVRSKFPDKLLVMGGYAWKDGSVFFARLDEAQALAEIGDGIYVSEFLRVPISKTTDFRSEANWKKDVDLLSTASNKDRIVLLRTAFSDAASQPDETQLRQWMMYTVSSYLLGKNGKQTFMAFDVNGRSDIWRDALFTVPLGTAQDAYDKLKTGIYRRNFSNGIVLVNASNETKKADLDREYRSLSGVLTKSISMTANTGLILLKP